MLQGGICGVLALLDALRGSTAPEAVEAHRRGIQALSEVFLEAAPLSLQHEAQDCLDAAQAALMACLEDPVSKEAAGSGLLALAIGRGSPTCTLEASYRIPLSLCRSLA